jgi:hypothetical protein
MTQVHQYQASCAVERRWAPVLDEWLSAEYLVREATTEEQWRGIDRFLADGENTYTVDYKCDEKWKGTGNVFVEITSNQKTGRAGWALTSEADWLMYFLTPARVLALRFETLRRDLPAWQKRYPIRSARNEEGYITVGVCVPVRVVEVIAEYAVDIDSGLSRLPTSGRFQLRA